MICEKIWKDVQYFSTANTCIYGLCHSLPLSLQYCSKCHPKDPALQGFWDILDFAWGDPNQYDPATLAGSTSTDSLGDAGHDTGGDEDHGHGGPSAEVATTAPEAPNAGDDDDVIMVEDPATEHLVPYVPDYMVPDNQGECFPTESEVETTPEKLVEPKTSGLSAGSEPSQSTASAVGALGDVYIAALGDAVKEAQNQLLLAQLRLARCGGKETQTL